MAGEGGETGEMGELECAWISDGCGGKRKKAMDGDRRGGKKAGTAQCALNKSSFDCTLSPKRRNGSDKTRSKNIGFFI